MFFLQYIKVAFWTSKPKVADSIPRVAKKAAGITREEGLRYVRSLRKVSSFKQQISAKSAGTRNKKPILNDRICIFCNLKALNSHYLEEDLKT